jgi:hypothetical protein
MIGKKIAKNVLFVGKQGKISMIGMAVNAIFAKKSHLWINQDMIGRAANATYVVKEEKLNMIGLAVYVKDADIGETSSMLWMVVYAQNVAENYFMNGHM